MALPEKTIGVNYGWLTTAGRKLIEKKEETGYTKPATTVENTPSSTVEGGTSSTVEYIPPSTVEPMTATTVKAAHLWLAEGAGGIFTSSRLRRITCAQDALTHVEEAVYDALWGSNKKPEQEQHRLTQIGYSELARKSRVSKRT